MRRILVYTQLRIVFVYIKRCCVKSLDIYLRGVRPLWIYGCWNMPEIHIKACYNCRAVRYTLSGFVHTRQHYWNRLGFSWKVGGIRPHWYELLFHGFRCDHSDGGTDFPHWRHLWKKNSTWVVYDRASGKGGVGWICNGHYIQLLHQLDNTDWIYPS